MPEPIFGELAPLRRQQIPFQKANLALKQGYRSHPLDPHGPASDEKLVDLRTIGIRGENFYSSSRNPPHYGPIPGAIAELWVREGIAERLLGIDAKLQKAGLALWIFDAWRPDAIQAYFYDNWMPNALRELRPELGLESLQAEVSNYWSQPTTEAASPAPHLTGGAIDISLCWADTNERLWMGSIFDDVSAIAHTDHFERSQSTELAMSDDEARANRRLLYWTMRAADFCSNPTEWWHYSYGDQMWARLSGAATAFYGAASPP